MPEPRRAFPRWLLLPVILVIAALGGVYADWRSAEPADALAKATYVGRESCVECHQQEHQDWLGSHHDHAMEPANEQTVLADFDDATFERMGVTTRFFRDGERFMVNTEGPDGKLHDYHVKYTFGYTPLQQYMVEFPDGRVQVLRVSWDTLKKEWFYVTPPDVLDERIWPGDPLHWTGIAQNWNTTCAICHSTNLQKNYDVATDTYHTTWSEIDVSCEECHGPGSLHLRLASASSLFWDRRHGYGLARLKTLDNTPQIEACAKCHSRRNDVHPDFRPGKPLLDYYEPSLLHAGLYHADGQILDEVYVYGSFLQSRMHREGVRCTDCHNPHSLKTKFDGNALCAQCHEPAKYDVVAHHHHQPGTLGAACVECHMPETKYMVVDPRRDHSIRMPRPDLTVSVGTPNACNNCHVKPEEDAQWAADKVVEWYGPVRRNDPHWAPAIAAGRAAAPEGEKLLAETFHGPTTPPLVKATALELLAQYTGDDAQRVQREGLASFNPMLRTSAVRTYNPTSSNGLVETLVPKLEDPVRSVRIEAARRLMAAPAESMTVDQYRALNNALEEFREQQAMVADRAAGHLNLGQLEVTRGNRDKAIEEFSVAMNLEPYLAGPRRYIAQLLMAGQGDQQQVQELLKEEIELLERDVKLAPGNDLTWYELGRLRVVTGDYANAPRAFAAACRLSPGNYDYRLMHALSLERRYEMTRNDKDFDAARDSLRALNALAPDRRDAESILQRLNATRASGS